MAKAENRNYLAAVFVASILKALFLGVALLFLLKDATLASTFALWQGVAAMSGGVASSAFKNWRDLAH
jgi:hypothetical protein